MYGINLNPLLPVRTEPKEQAEMCTQLLFGELFSIIETTEKWLFIRNKADSYEGWIDKKTATGITENEFNELSAQSSVLIFKPLASCFIRNKSESIILPAGSSIHHYNNENGDASFAGNTFVFPTDALMKRGARPASGHLVVSMAKAFLNAPYLWGGKSVMGIDCSGLVQLCFSICGIQLPRDASKQVSEGEMVNSLQESQTGDLAFFENENGKIIHVGILVDNTAIIHASGKVKIEKIDNTGIISQENGNYTHKLKAIKRI